MNQLKLSFVGLGEMGFPMARRLLDRGWQLAGSDRSDDIQHNWQGVPGIAVHSLDESDVVLVCVTDEAASRQVLDVCLNRLRPGALIIDHSTTSASWARQANERASSAGIGYCDAPISGGAAGAQSGELVVMLGAVPDQLPFVRSVCSAYVSKLVHLGPPGCGQACKMANQLAIAGIAAGLADAISISRAHGLSAAQVLEVLASGSANSVQLSRLRPALERLDCNVPATFRWMQKDLRICDEAASQGSQGSQGTPGSHASQASLHLPLTQLWQQHWLESEG